MKSILSIVAAGLLWTMGLSWAQDSSDSSTVGSSDEVAGPLLLYKQGQEFSKQAEYEKALDHFKRASQLSRGWVLPYLAIAQLHMVTDNDRNAIQAALQEAVRLGTGNPRARYLYGIFLLENDQKDEAMAEFLKALELRSDFIEARFRLANLYCDLGKESEAIEQYQLLLEKEPGNLGAHRNLASLYEKTSQAEQAERHLKTIVQLFPDNVYHLSQLAEFYKRQGQTQQADLVFRKIEKIDRREQRKLRPLLKSKR